MEKLNKIEEIFGIPFLKKGSGIHIKKKNKGLFTKYCNGKVTNECIQKGKNSPDPKIRKRAIFAANSRRWKHQQGGFIPKNQYDIRLQFINLLNKHMK